MLFYGEPKNLSAEQQKILTFEIMLNYVKFLNKILNSMNGYFLSANELVKILVVSKIVHKNWRDNSLLTSKHQ